MNAKQDRSRLETGPQPRGSALYGDQCHAKGREESLRGKIKRAGWDDAYLARLLSLF